MIGHRPRFFPTASRKSTFGGTCSRWAVLLRYAPQASGLAWPLEILREGPVTLKPLDTHQGSKRP
jgi:hypothetical protein